MWVLWLMPFHSRSSARAAIMSSDLDYTCLPHQQTSVSFELAGINLHRNEQELQEFRPCQGEKQNFKPSCFLGKMASPQLSQPETTTWCLAHVLTSNTFKYTDLSYLTTWGVTVPHIHTIHSSMQCRNIFRGASISAISLAGRYTQTQLTAISWNSENW